MKNLFWTIWEYKLALFLAALFLTSVGVGPDGYDSKEDPSCEDCEKEVEAIIFSPAFLKVLHMVESIDGPETATATYSGKAADWIITKAPSRQYVRLFDWKPKLNSKTTTVEVVGDQDFSTFRRRTEETKLKMTARPIDPKDNFLFDSRWLTIYAKSPDLRYSAPAAYPLGRYLPKWRPMMTAGETRTFEVHVEDSPSWRRWAIVESPGFEKEVYSVAIQNGAGKNDFSLTVSIVPDFWDKIGPSSIRFTLQIRSPNFADYFDFSLFEIDIIRDHSFQLTLLPKEDRIWAESNRGFGALEVR